MTDTLLTSKYAHRFRQLDTDGDGFLTRVDVRGHARDLLRALGIPEGTPPAQTVYTAADSYWAGLSRYTGGGEDGLDVDAFIAALDAARADGGLEDVVRPAVQAHLVVADVNGDGAVDRPEFLAAQTALGTTAADAEEAFRRLDRNGVGRISLDDWLTAVMEYYSSTDPAAPGNRIFGYHGR